MLSRVQARGYAASRSGTGACCAKIEQGVCCAQVLHGACCPRVEYSVCCNSGEGACQPALKGGWGDGTDLLKGVW